MLADNEVFWRVATYGILTVGGLMAVTAAGALSLAFFHLVRDTWFFRRQADRATCRPLDEAQVSAASARLRALAGTDADPAVVRDLRPRDAGVGSPVRFREPAAKGFRKGRT